MNPEELATYLKKGLIKKGASEVVVTAQIRNAHQIKYSNNKINATKKWDQTDIGVFACYNKRIVVTNTRDISKSSADDAIKNIINLAKVSQPNKEFQGIAKGSFKYKKIEDGYDKKIAGLEEKGVEYVEDAINLSVEQGSNRCSGVFEFGENIVFLTTSNNVEASEKLTRAYFSTRVFINKEASGHMVSVSRILKDLKINDAVLKATSIAKQAVNPKSISPGKYDVVFDYLPFANLIAQVGNAASIFAVESGLSCLEGKLNKKIGMGIITLIDDATLPNGLNSIKFDAEGVPTRKNTIIKEGVLKTYLHNTSTAKKHKTKTTANAGLVSPEPFNIVVKKGSSSESDLISQTKKGIYITNVWYTRFQNYHTGDFSTIPRDGAFLIKDGRIIHPVKDIRLSDNLLNILKSTSALGNKSVQIKGWEVEIPVETPMALVRNLNITKSES